MRTNNEAATVTMNHHLTFTKPQLLMAFESHETIRRPGASRRSGRSGCPG